VLFTRAHRVGVGAARLPSVRDSKRGWRAFPFWYTVLALSEMDFGEATAELKHAAPALERTAGRRVAPTVYARRRRDLAVRALTRL
jgi:hypothetical protein